jgi:O-methyltransferase involved in polyketide biosynthesis
VTRAAGDQRHVCFVAVDLMTDDIAAALIEAGYDRYRPGLFLCEGLFSYLPNVKGRDLCERLASLAAGGGVLAASFLVVPPSRRHPLQVLVDGVLATIGERRLGSYQPGAAEEMLTETGWAPVNVDRTNRSRSSGSHLLLIAARRL